MKSACYLLLFFTLLPAYLAIKCFCDGEHCVDSGPQEECPDRLGEEYFAKHADDDEILEQLPKLYQARATIRWALNGKELTEQDALKLMPKWTAEAKDFYNNMTFAQRATFTESLLEIVAFSNANYGNRELLKKDLPGMYDKLFNHTFVPKPVSYQFCMKVVNGNGKTERSCGLILVQVLGGVAEVGCHANPHYMKGKIDYPKYCRCDTDLCNSGDIEREKEETSSASKCSSTWVLTCVLLALMLKTIVD